MIGRIPNSLGVAASLITLGGAAVAIYAAVSSGGSDASPTTEAKQIVSFHQLANRICVENGQDLEQALPEAHSRVQLLGYLSRGTGWGINDLEGVTPPAKFASAFTEELALRSRIKQTLLEVQRAGETGELSAKAEAVGSIDSLEEQATDLNHELGLRRCAPVLPRKVKEAIDVG
jgi:hypothetical protein